MNKKDKFLYILTDLLIGFLILFHICVTANKIDYDKKNNINLQRQIKELTQKNEELEVELLEYQEKYSELLSESCVTKQELIEPLKIYDMKEYYLLYKEIEDEYSEEFGRPLNIYDVYTEEDIYYIQRCVETECFDCPFENKVNVANVIINRVASDKFADTPKGVVTSPNQFAYFRTNITEDTILAVEYAFMFEDTTDGALYFHSGKYSETFNGANYIFEDSVGHKFYK